MISVNALVFILIVIAALGVGWVARGVIGQPK